MFEAALHQDSGCIVCAYSDGTIHYNQLIANQFIQAEPQFPQRYMYGAWNCGFQPFRYLLNVLYSIGLSVWLVRVDSAELVQFMDTDKGDQMVYHVFCNKSKHIDRILCR